METSKIIVSQDENGEYLLNDIPAIEYIEILKGLGVLKLKHLYLEKRNEEIRAKYKELLESDRDHKLRNDVVIEITAVSCGVSTSTVNSVLYDKTRHKERFCKLEIGA